MVEGNYITSLKNVDTLLKNTESEVVQQFEYLVLKGTIFLYQLDHQRTMEIADYVIAESKKLNKPLYTFGAINLKCQVLQYTLAKSNEVPSLIQEAKKILEAQSYLEQSILNKRKAFLQRLQAEILEKQG